MVVADGCDDLVVDVPGNAAEVFYPYKAGTAGDPVVNLPLTEADVAHQNVKYTPATPGLAVGGVANVMVSTGYAKETVNGDAALTNAPTGFFANGLVRKTFTKSAAAISYGSRSRSMLNTVEVPSPT